MAARSPGLLLLLALGSASIASSSPCAKPGTADGCARDLSLLQLARGVARGAGEDDESFPEASQALLVLNSTYGGHVEDPFYNISLDVLLRDPEVKKMGDAGTYGEILPSTVVALLRHVGAKPGMRYYDLGSGLGKTVLLAGLLGLNATGVELSERRWSAACRASAKAAKQRPASAGAARFLHGSFLDVDFSDADIVFADSVTFTREMMKGMARAARHMKNGSKVITSGSTLWNEGLPYEGFADVDDFIGPTSWRNDSTWKVRAVAKGGGPSGSPRRNATKRTESCGW